MSELVFGVICFAAGVVTAVLVPRVFAFAQRAIGKAKSALPVDKE